MNTRFPFAIPANQDAHEQFKILSKWKHRQEFLDTALPLFLIECRKALFAHSTPAHEVADASYICEGSPFPEASEMAWAGEQIEPLTIAIDTSSRKPDELRMLTAEIMKTFSEEDVVLEGCEPIQVPGKSPQLLLKFDRSRIRSEDDLENIEVAFGKLNQHARSADMFNGIRQPATLLSRV